MRIIKRIIDRLLVGGAVRDKIMNIIPQDRDWLVLNKTSKEMIELGFKRVAKTSTAPVFIHPEDPLREEYAIPRREISTGDGYKDFEFETGDVTLKEDLQRRDFTINSMAMDNSSALIDPFGGQKDLHDGIIRHTNEDSFKEDPLRVIRAARFAARFDFKIADETIFLCREMCEDGMLVSISGERIYLEVKKALKQCDKPSGFFRNLLNLGALESIFPELYQMIGIRQPEQHHQEGDVFEHTMMALDASKELTTDISTKIAVLFHDVGKILTKKYEWPRHKGHTDSEAKDCFCKIADRLVMDNYTRKVCINAIEFHMKFHLLKELKAGSICKIFNKLKVKHRLDLVESFITVGMCDELGRIPKTNTSLFYYWSKMADCFNRRCIIVIPEDREYSGIAYKNMAIEQQVRFIKSLRSNLCI